MEDFKSVDNSYKYGNRQSENGLFSDRVFSNNGKKQYICEQENKTLDKIPEEALVAIKKFDSLNYKLQTQSIGQNELEVCNYIWSPNMKKTLLYALESGTAYTIYNENIYIWYKPFKGFEGSGFYRLKRFVFLEGGRTVKYFLDGSDKIPNPL